SITFPTTDYTARHVNFNLSVPLTVKDVADSIIASPTRTWRTKDTTTATIGAATGVLRVKKLGTDTVWAKVDTVERSQRIVVAQVAGSLTKFQGDARSDTVAKPVTVVPTVTVLDSGLTPIVGASVTFRAVLGANFNASVQDTLQVTDANGRAKPTSWKLSDFAGTNNNTLVATSGAQSTTFTVSSVAGTPRQLRFSVQPASAAVGAAISPALTVEVQDSLGNRVTTATSSITLAFGNNPSTATLGGTLTVAAVAGVATFSSITVSASGSGYTLQASSATLTSAISNGFDAFGAANNVEFITQPSNVTTGAVMAPAVKVAVKDASGATVTNATSTITLSISTNPGGATLGGTVSAAAVAGVATFSNLTLNQLGTGYVLAATATGLTAGNSNTFNVVAVGPGTKLAFTAQPSNVVAGASITPAIQVTVQDSSGATVTSPSVQITLKIDAAANPDSSTISGGSTVSAFTSNGVATFGAVSLNKAGTGYKLTASNSSLTGATSDAFNVAFGTATKLGFMQQPTHTVFSQTMTPAVTIARQDANGNTVTGPAQVSVTISLGGCAATLGGTTTATTAAGVATYSNLSIATQVSNCTLGAASTGLTSATSTAFNSVAATGAVKLGFITNPPTNTTAGSSLGTIQVALQNASGATVTTATSTTVTLALGANPGSGSLTGTVSASTSSGIATFAGNTLSKAATGYTLAATATGYQSATGSAFNITPGTATKLGFIQQPSTTTAGVQFTPPVQVAVQDANGNTVTSSAASVTLQFSGTGASGGSFSGGSTLTVSAVNGVAGYGGPGSTVKKANTNYVLLATSSGLFSSTSSSFNIDKAPVSLLAFSTQPSASYTAGNAINVTVQTQDSVGNLYTDPSAAITLSLTGGAAGAVMSGTKTVTPVSGSASFTNLSIDKAGTLYQLNASASGFATNVSNTFTINPGTANKLGWVDQPQATFIGAPLNPSGQLPRIAIQDALGNTVTSNNSTTVRVMVGVGPSGSFKSSGTTVTQVDFIPTAGIVTVSNSVAMSTVGTFQMAANTPFTALTGANSNPFVVSAFDVKSKLGFVQAPGSTTYRVSMTPAVTVAVQDQYGNTVTTATDAVSIAIGTDPIPTTTLGGGSATTATAGVATFADLTLNRTSGTGYTLVASATGLTPVTSGSFTMSAPGIVTTNTFINDLVELGDQIYFTHGGALKSVSVFGGTVTTVASSTNSYRLATDATNIYWVEQGATNSGDASIKKLTVSSGALTTLASGLTSAGVNNSKIYSDGTNVYFVARDLAATGLAIRKIQVNASSGTPTDVVSAGSLTTSNAPNFLLNGGFLYYRDFTANTITRLPTGGGAAVQLTVAGHAGKYFAMDGTTLYFSDGVNVKSIANANTISAAVTPTTVISGSTTIYDLAVDGSYLYVQYSATLRRYNVSDFSTFATVSAAVDQFAHSIAFDSFDVYFNENTGKIAKLPKQ
ncbi:MAG: hypothetical protein AABZ80_09265, partial [Gemmatimonadota bacterium]